MKRNVLGVYAVRQLVLLDVLLVTNLEVVVGDLDALAELGQIQKAVFYNALLCDRIAALVLFVVSLDSGVVERDFGFEIFGFD